MHTTRTFVKVKLYGVIIDALVGGMDWSHKQKCAGLMWLVLCGQSHETRNGMVCARWAGHMQQQAILKGWTFTVW